MWRTSRSVSMSPLSSSIRSSSKDRSKWSSIARFWDDVTTMTCSMPDATASSTAYWMTGLSTSGSISLGDAFVAGRNRVPHPAAGKTAFRTRIEPRVRVGGGARSIAIGIHRLRRLVCPLVHAVYALFQPTAEAGPGRPLVHALFQPTAETGPGRALVHAVHQPTAETGPGR